MPGCARWNAASRGTSHSDANEIVVATVSDSSRVPLRACAVASRIAASALPTAAANAAPADVSASVRWRRSNSATPRLASSAWICRLTADCVRCSSAAARVKLRWRAAAANAGSVSSGGRSRLGMRFPHARHAE
jgi:hypothetical protein